MFLGWRANIRVFCLSSFLLVLVGCAGMSEPQPEITRVAELNVRLGLDYLRQERFQLAKTKLERALSASPHSSQVQWAYALLQDKLGHEEAAERHFRKAISLSPNDAYAHNNYGSFLCRQGKVKKGLAEFDKAGTNPLYPEPESAWVNAGICLIRSSEDDVSAEEAEQYFRKALEENPEYVLALYQMAALTSRQQRYLASRAYRQRLAEALQRDNPKVLWLCVVTERALNNDSEAARCAATLKADFPTSRETALLYQ